MSDFCPAVFDGDSLIDVLDSLLGDWQTYDYSGHGRRHREEIKPLIESLANGEISVSARTNSNHTSTWDAVIEITLPKEFWRYAKYYFERPQRALFEVPAPGKRVIYSDPRIVVAAAALVKSNVESPQKHRPPPANKRLVCEWVRNWIAELQSNGEQGSQERVWSAAQEHFKGAERRNIVLASYHKLAPAEWKKQGRRRQNPPNNSPVK